MSGMHSRGSDLEGGAGVARGGLVAVCHHVADGGGRQVDGLHALTLHHLHSYV